MSEKDTADLIARALQPFAKVLDALVSRLEKLEAPKPGDKKLTPDEMLAEMMGELRGTNQDLSEFGLIDVVDGCVSDSGATFDAEVQYSPVKIKGRVVGKDPKGVVKVLRNYAWPAGIDKHAADGGVVPDGMTMMEQGPGGMQETDAYRQWKYDEFYKADARRYIGKPLPSHVRRNAPKAVAV